MPDNIVSASPTAHDPWAPVSPKAGGSAPQVPDYDLLRRIGGGAYGEVWLARSNATGALRAVKIVWRHTFQDERPFQREFEGIQKFEHISREHPSQLALFHIGRNEAEGYFYYVMELADDLGRYSDGGLESGSRENGAAMQRATAPSRQDSDSYVPHTLRAELADGRLPAARVLEIGVALSEALAHLHAKGLVHRDVKPSNVIFVNGRPKLADIGLVTDASDQCSIVGTEGYLPPEGPGTPQADIFALGKVLYEAATGMDRRRFPELPEDLISWPDTGEVVELNEVLLRACAKDPALRYASTDEMRSELQLLRSGSSVLRVRQTERWRQGAKRGAAWLLATLVVAALVTLLIQSYHDAALRNSAGAALGQVYHPKPSTNELANQELEIGEEYFDKLTGADFARAAEHFEAATKADAYFAQAWSKLGSVLTWSDFDVWNPEWKYVERARECALRALSLDANLAQPHCVLAGYYAVAKWDWERAEQEHQLALQLENSAEAHMIYAENLRLMGRKVEALRQLATAIEMDPRSITKKVRLVAYQIDFMQFDKALSSLKIAQALDQTRDFWQLRAEALRGQGDYKAAIDVELEALGTLAPKNPGVQAHLERLQRCLQANEPKERYWQTILEEVKEQNDSNGWYDQARAYAQLNQTNESIACLKHLLARHAQPLTFRIMTDHCLDPVRSEPDFHEILKAMHLDKYAGR